MSPAPDPSDKTLDAAAADNFGGKHTNRRAGYGDQLEMILRIAQKGGTLAAGEGLRLVAHYEALVRAAFVEGCEQECALVPTWDRARYLEALWDESDAKAAL